MDDNETTINTTAFLFGNLNKKGQLEAEDEDFASINKLSDCRLEEINNSLETLFSQHEWQTGNLQSSQDISNYENVDSVDFYDEKEYIDDIELSSIVDTNVQINAEDEYDICTGQNQEPPNNMPPPSDVPFNIQNKRNNHDRLNCTNQPQYQSDNIVNMHQNEYVNTLNTPLGSILPLEYVNVDIQTLFPHYFHDKIPRWSKLFKAFHEPKLYRPLDELKLNHSENHITHLKSDNENYIYDDYGINLGVMPPIEMICVNDADIFSLPAKSFADCEVPVSFRDIQPCSDNTNRLQSNNISNRTDNSNNFQKRTKFQQEMKRKRKRDDKSNRFKSTDSQEMNVKKCEVLTGLSWRDGPASYWYDMYNVPLDENILEYRVKPSISSDDSNHLTGITSDLFKDTDCMFSTWQLVNWEADIIIDPQSVRNQIMESNKKYACHAGWIPSIKHRNMGTFQDAACGEYMGIWQASSTGTLIQGPDVSHWHSVFALENAQMIETDWVNKIIIDPRHPNAQEPYLLELDLNNECIHFDFTNTLQTKEILTSELNSVYLTSSSTPQPTAVENNVTDNTDGVLLNSSNTDTPNKEKQLKKMKILSKLSEVTEVEEKPKEQQIEATVEEPFSLIQYRERDTYLVVPDHQSDKNTFFMDIVDLEVPDTTEAVTPLIRHGIQHSLSAIQLDPTFFPLKLDNQFLRHMHRSRLSDVKQLISCFNRPQPICNLIQNLKQESEQRQKICKLTGNGDLFFMRSINDLSASTDHIILAEYSEEYPPLMMQTGMASRIINYFHGQSNQPIIMPQLPYGELCVTPQVPFLGQLSPNQIFHALENNMFRAPIYPHKLRSNDFLVIMKSNTICVRRVNDVFLVGQELPLVEVPAPNSKKANTFLKDFLQVQIIRMFLQSQNEPKRIRHDEIRAMFSEQSDSALKKRLKMFAEYKKADNGNNSGFWVLKPEFQLPTEDELIELITPEECCAYYSMMWGLCRLEDAGYNSKSFIQAEPEQQDDDEEKESNLKIEDEVKAAPWHTTKTFLDAQKGKCYLELIGATEPTGCGEGFSYARVSAKGSLFKETQKNKINKPSNTSGTHVPGLGKRMVTGTDADLRKLTLKKAYALLKECGISEHDFKKLKRWDIIDLVRQMSTQKANQGEEEAMIKFARSSKMTVAGQEERYKNECQRIFNLQNQVLANEEELTSDDGGSEDEDDNCDDLRKSIYGALDSRLNVQDDDMELLRKVKRRPDVVSETNSVVDGACIAGGEGSSKTYVCPASADNARAISKCKAPVPKTVPKALCIRRQVENADGTKTAHCQTIPWSSIVKIYFKMNEVCKTDYLMDFCGLNHSKEDEKKARRKQQDKIRRLKRQQKQKIHSHIGHGTVGMDPNNMAVKKKYRTKVFNSAKIKAKLQTTESLANIKCGACGKKGHMRTNKECPQYGKSVKKAFGKRSIHRSLKSNKTIFQLLNPDKVPPLTGGQPDHMKPEFNQLDQSLTDNNNDGLLSDSMHDHINTQDNYDDHTTHQQSVLAHMGCGGDDNEDEHDPASGLKLVIPKQLIAQYSTPSNLTPSHDKSRGSMKKGSKLSKDLLPGSLKRQHSSVISKKSQVATSSALSIPKGNEYMIDQKMRGNRRRIDPRVALNHQFEEIYKGLLQVTGYRCFLHPVRKRECPSYYSIIENPMDLSTVKMKINNNSYETRESFLDDIKLIYNNCIKFNGESNEYTIIAKQLMSHVMEQFCAKERKLMRLEKLVNPLMDEDDMVGMRYILEQTVTAMEEVEHSRPFHTPVDKKKYPDYVDKIARPMDLQTLRANIKADKYRSREDFMADANLILANCFAYNGDNSLLSAVSLNLIKAANHMFTEREDTFNTLESNLKNQFDDGSDSAMAVSSCMTDHLSHMDVEEMMDTTLDTILDETCKKARYSGSGGDDEDEKPVSRSSRSSVDANRERIMADLQLTDSDANSEEDNEEEDDDYEDTTNHEDLPSSYPRQIGTDGHRRRSVSGSDAEEFHHNVDGFDIANEPMIEQHHSTFFRDTSNQYYYQNSDNNSDNQDSPPNVTFYISDDE